MENHFLLSAILLPNICVHFLLPHLEYDVYSENTSQCHFVYQKSHLEYPKTEPGAKGRPVTASGMAWLPKDENYPELHLRMQFVPHSKHTASPL